MDKSKVLQKIDDKINEIFLECQEELNIKYGDISPDEAFKLEELEEKLADLICFVLSYEE